MTGPTYRSRTGKSTSQESRNGRKVVIALVVAAVLTLGAVLANSCDRGEAEVDLPAPAQAVDDLLALRAERSTDASAYAEYVVDDTLAIELAQAAEAEVESTATPTPDWETPYVSADRGQDADVVVVWIPDDSHPGWTTATIFTVILDGEDWRVADALPVEEDLPPPTE